MRTQANNVRTLRPRTKYAATNRAYARSVRDLMAEIEEREIAGRIKKAREQAGLRQHQLAARLAVQPRTYQNYESETKPRIPWDRLNEIAKITGRPSEWLVYGEVLDGQSTSQDQLDRIEDMLELVLSLLRETGEVEPALPTMRAVLARLAAAEPPRRSRTPRKQGGRQTGEEAA
jgi:transcriptional regulator with XRE-family HTH domain